MNQHATNPGQDHVKTAESRSAIRIYAGCVIAVVTLFILMLVSPGMAGDIFASTPNYLLEMFQGWQTLTATPRPGYLLITEVMYDPTGEGSEPGGEWIEVYNAGGTAVDLQFYKLGDEETLGGPEGMFLFPTGATLGPGEVIIVANDTDIFYDLFGRLPHYELNDSHAHIPEMVKYSPWSGGNIELSNGGDEVLLLNVFDERVDGLSWGNSNVILDPPAAKVQEGHSLERNPADVDNNSADDWVEQDAPAPGKVDLSVPTPTPTNIAGGTPTPQGSFDLLVSEVLYDPVGDEPEGELFEIYNFGSAQTNLEGLRIGDEETVGGEEGMLVFPQGSSIGAGQAKVIANRADVFSDTFGSSPDFEIYDSDPTVPEMLRDSGWGSGAVALNNSGDEIILLDWNGLILDAVSWGDSTFAFDPPVQLIPEGHSLERYPPGADSDSAADWRDQPAPAPGEVDLTPPTPTPTPTPTSAPVSGMVINELHADPDPTQGDANGDGFVDNEEDEFIEIVNVTGAAVDLGDWEIRDFVGLRHLFPPGSVVADGCAALVFGGGTPSGGFGGSLVQVASSGRLGMNNDGDTLTLFDSGGVPVVAYTFSSEGGDDQSLTRSPDIVGPDPLVKHTTAPGSGGALFSPGTRLDDFPFSGCGTLKP